MAFSPDSNRLVSTGLDYSVRVWDAKTGQEVWHKDRYEGVGTPWAATFIPDTSFVFVGYSQGAVCNYSVQLQDELGQYHPVAFSKKSLKRLVVNASGRLLAVGESPEVVVMDTVGHQTGSFRGHTANVADVALNPNGHRAVSGGADKVVRVWDVVTGKEVQAFEGHTAAVASVAFSPDGTRVVSGGADKTIRLWTLAEPVGPRSNDPTGDNPDFQGAVKRRRRPVGAGRVQGRESDLGVSGGRHLHRPGREGRPADDHNGHLEGDRHGG